MIFLKKFVANGFKAFSTKTQIDFKNNMSGIVGPNGSGKSNIVDAIKWVLGEKSNKNLRSKISEDVIFHGSKEHSPSKFAEITLEFDNSNKALHTDAKNVVITRKLVKGDGNNEYYLNNEPCRLKDIQDIFLDTGLSKGSLGIISQGTVQWFVDAKPEERRTIFEDAAGIGLYSKKREESLRQLDKTQENLNRINDITNELHTVVNKLQRQAKKAKLFSQKQKELKHLDLTMMVKDLKYFTERLKIINHDIVDARDKLQIFEPNVKELTQSIKFAKEKQEIADANFDALSGEFNNLIDQINKLEIKKSSVNSQLQSDLNSKDIKKRSDALLTLINSEKTTIDDAKQNISKLKSGIEVYSDSLNSLTSKRDELNNQVSEYSNKVVEIRTKIKNLVDQLNVLNSTDIGPKSVIENRKAFTGIKGLVKDFLIVDDQYQVAINTALNKNSQNVIVEKNIDAQNAVEFLKTNRAGKATFLPLESIKPKAIRPEHLEIINNKEGFIGVASDLVNSKEDISSIIGFLLGNIIIADDLNNAFVLSKLTYQLYRVVTLDGDFISPGGSVTGGYTNKTNIINQANPQATLNELNKQYPLVNDQYLAAKAELEKVMAEFNDVNSKVSEKKILLSKYEETLKNSENQLIKYEGDYKQLVKSNDLTDKSNEWNEQNIEAELVKLVSKKNKINEDLNIARNNKNIFKAQILDQENKLNEIRFQLDSARDVVSKHQAEKVKCESIIENSKNKINQTYKMTLEFAMANYNEELPMSDQQAREAIVKLQDDIARLGNINLDALNELEENQKRYEDLSAQQKELEKAKNDIEQIIKSLDEKALTDFANTIDKVNKNLPEVFKYLFGGGTCKIEYTDPQNILTSGIDVIVVPFGKNVTRLSLLSGGEKSLVALSILFAILKIKSFPLVILDEAESALDPANVERFANMIQASSNNTQFIVITHRPGTMERCDILFGATMQIKGVTSIYQVQLAQAQSQFGSDEPH